MSSRAVAQRVVANAAMQAALWSSALAAAKRRGKGPAGPKGLGGVRGLYARNDDGEYATDPVSLNVIPVSRAVRINKKYFDERTLRQLFRHQRLPRNPLTRQPFPPAIVSRFQVKKKMQKPVVPQYVPMPPRVTVTEENQTMYARMLRDAGPLPY
jgi:hypothetical protein